MLTLTYNEMESALARVHGVEAHQKTAFQGRLKHFMKLGLPDIGRPGTGKKIAYSEEHVWQVALALEFSQLGMDPSWFVPQILADWTDIRALIRTKPERLCIPLNMMQWDAPPVLDLHFVTTERVDFLNGSLRMAVIRFDKLLSKINWELRSGPKLVKALNENHIAAVRAIS